MNPRSVGIDLVRVLAIVAIVAGHTSETTWLRNVTYTWHVPVFFFLTGYLWRARRTVRDEITQRARTLLIPYIAWLAVIALIYIPISGDAGNTVAHMVVGGRYTYVPFGVVWFITALFFAAVIYRVLTRDEPPTWKISAVALVSAVIAASVGHRVAQVPEALGSAFTALVFLAAGHLFARFRSELPDWLPLVLLPLAAALIAGDVSQPLDMKQGNFGTPVVSILVALSISVGLTIAAERLSPLIAPRAQSAITALAAAGLAVVFAHGLVIYLIHASPFVEFVAALVISWGVGLAIARTPAAPIFLGRTPPRPVLEAGLRTPMAGSPPRL